jgi:hypothetical protein
MAVSRILVASFLGCLFLLGAQFAAFGGQLHTRVVREVPATYTPHLRADSAIRHPMALAVAEGGNSIFVGGKFAFVENSARTIVYPRNNIFAFDATTGEVSSSFVPQANGTVFATLAHGDSVYVGGEFTEIGGVSRRAIAKLDALTGAVDPAFNANFSSGRVSEIRLVNGRLIVGGSFPKKLAALNPLTGVDTRYIRIPITGQLPLTTSRTEVYRFAVNPAGDLLVGVGNFTAVDGQNRRRAFMLDLGATGATLNPWYYAPLDNKCRSNTPTRQPYLDDVDFSPDGTYFVFAATGFVPVTSSEVGTMICDCAARFETNIVNPVRPTWINYTGGDTVHSVIVTGAAVYVQGHFRWLNNPQGVDSAGPGAVNRRGIGAIDPVTGLALAWNPAEPARQGGQDLLATTRGLWAMSDTLRFNNKYHRGIAFVPLPPR